MREVSAQVLRDCALPNGAIVAAHGEHQPPTAVSYHYVWGRDAAHQLEGAQALGMSDAAAIRAGFIGWVLERAPGVAEFTGDDSSRLLRKRNYINGPNDRSYNDDGGFQPDNNGLLLAAIDATRQYPDANDDRAMRLLANGLAARWDTSRQHFNMLVQDQWENALAGPTEGIIFTPSLLAAAHGLHCAVLSLKGKATDSEREVWEQAYTQMRDQFLAASVADTSGFYKKRLYGTSNQLDAGLALAIPDLLPPHASELVRRMGAETIRRIGELLLEPPYGARRYIGDTYDGIETAQGIEGGAGAWPLLGYAWTRAARHFGMTEQAADIQAAMDDHLQTLYDQGILPPYRVPEQLFPIGDPRNGKGPVHFGWGSAEWALADRDRRLAEAS